MTQNHKLVKNEVLQKVTLAILDKGHNSPAN